VLKVTPEMLAFAKEDVAKTYDERVKQSHKTTEKEMKVHNRKVNFSRVNMDTVGDYHTEGVLLAPRPALAGR
jgi:hypothetical protein